MGYDLYFWIRTSLEGTRLKVVSLSVGNALVFFLFQREKDLWIVGCAQGRL